ncbi:hypothetical protein [Stappia sp.]|uniref:hypothetical protein n=1 Tax=Stappia sp. TaxID=1870903 RepID=UPI0032D9A2EF
MIFTLISTFVLGIAVAGILLLLNRATGNRLPKWIAPAAAGLAMLVFTVWTEYNWLERTRAGLPAGLEVVETYQSRNLLQPWTYVVPRTNRFVALDRTTVTANDKDPRFRKASLFLFTRFLPVTELRQIYDCAQNRRIDLVPGELVDPTTLPDAAWEPLTDDPIAQEVCKGAA